MTRPLSRASGSVGHPGVVMAPNMYDDEAFFARYRQLPRSQRGLEGAPEWPDVQTLLPDLDGARVIDLGCGFGAFARWAVESGAAAVTALDGSERMLAEARRRTTSKEIEYRSADLELTTLPAARFDLAYSALVLHYLHDLAGFAQRVFAALRPGGSLVVTFEHPVYMAPHHPQWTEVEGRRVWPLDGYADEGLRVTDWMAPGVRKQHRTLGTTVNTFIDAGFVVRRLIEWAPTAAAVRADPALAAERDRPMFCLLSARRD